MDILAGLSDEDLDQPSKAIPEGTQDFFGLYAQCFFAVSHHCVFHGGQVVDARRALGRKPLMA